ncbi:hypothetical protein FCH28_01445 [Streptomyces piniterrae]|uniref:DUF1963 domain-containing protein n=1 Tax=Streptomyces piniterrae TaxID=2571125 RepID=A0A4U0NXF6_9ACTN|nr:hypothetical protein [Streptomyces piniterrae]TJZ58852.1 hypothetical protein FCH28_01445 [Streptomyces piniterrae]
MRTPPRPIDVTAALPELAAHARQTTRLHPRPGAPSVADSSIGGPLLWPADEPWPACSAPPLVRRGEPLEPSLTARLKRAKAEREERRRSGLGSRLTAGERALLDDPALRGKSSVDLVNYTAQWYEPEDHREPNPLVAVAQLHARDIPTVAFPPGADLLQVLWCPTDHQNPPGQPRYCGPVVHLVWRRAADVMAAPDHSGTAPPRPHDAKDCYLPTPCVLHPEQVTEYQYADLLPEALRDRLDALDEEWESETEYAYQYDLSIAPGCKAGGWASWHLTDPAAVDCRCGAPMDVLLTLASSEWDGGSGSWRPVENTAVERGGAATPTGLTHGRWGSLRIFSCPVDPRHPPRLNIQ